MELDLDDGIDFDAHARLPEREKAYHRLTDLEKRWTEFFPHVPFEPGAFAKFMHRIGADWVEGIMHRTRTKDLELRGQWREPNGAWLYFCKSCWEAIRQHEPND